MYFKYILLHSRVRAVINVILRSNYLQSRLQSHACDEIVSFNTTLRCLSSFNTPFGVSKMSDQFISSHEKDESQITSLKLNYFYEIQTHLNNNNLLAAKKVLFEMESNNIAPMHKLFQLVMEAFSRQGRGQDCFELLTKMLQLNLRITQFILHCTILSFIPEKNPKIAMLRLTDVVDIMNSQNVPDDEIPYYALFKFYNKFKMVDEALYAYGRMEINNRTVNPRVLENLLRCVNYGSNNTLELNLLLWHTIKQHCHYSNKMVHIQFWHNISATRCEFLALSGVISRGNHSININLIENGDTDLLASPPVLSKSSLSKFANLEDLGLRDIFEEDKFLLFGGYPKVLKGILSDGIEIDSHVLRILLKCLPNTDYCEDQFITHVKQYKVSLQTQFWNALIKRRCLRVDYESAKNTVMLMRAHGAMPNESTWQILALTCHTHGDIENYLYTLQKYGSTMNIKSIQTIISNVLHRGKKDGFFILHNLIEYMKENQISPVNEMITKIDQSFKVYEKTLDTLEGKQRQQFHKLVEYYGRWKREFNL